MKLFLSGGNGFLGTHIRQELDKNNIPYLAPSSSEVDLLDFEWLSEYLRQHKPDTILHLAARVAGILGNANNPAVFLRDNTQMGLNIYEGARLNGIKMVYSLGSVCMYASECPTPFKEDDLWNGAPHFSNAPFGQSKRTLLMLGQAYRKQYGIGGAHLIPVNLYGPGDNFDLENSHIVPALIRKMITAKKEGKSFVSLFGTGTSTRELLYAKDAAEAIVASVMTNLDTDLPINLGVGKDISIRDLAHLIAELVQFKGEIVFNGAVGDGQKKRLLDVSRAQKLLGWKAKMGLVEGLMKTIRYYEMEKL